MSSMTTVTSKLTVRTMMAVTLLFCVIQSAQVASAETIIVVIIVPGMNPPAITDWLKTSGFGGVSTSPPTIKSHNPALIRLYLIDVLHDG